MVIMIKVTFLVNGILVKYTSNNTKNIKLDISDSPVTTMFTVLNCLNAEFTEHDRSEE